MKRILCTISILGFAAAGALCQQSSTKTTKPAPSQKSNAIELQASPKTIVWGHYDAASAPALRVKSGDTVKVHTVLTNNPTRLAANNVPADQIEQSLKDIYAEGAVAAADKGPGGHILTGPIFIEGAEPGDVLEIRIKAIDLAIPYAYNGFGRTSGFLPEDFPYSKTKIIPLDKKRMVADFGPGIEIPLRPFFGSMGIAPPPAAGRVSSVPPGVYGGNMDNKYLVAGTTLYLPVNTEGALFEVGDGHAGQGDGEVDITAMETSLVGTFQFIVRKDLHFTWPRAETPTEFITMGMNKDLNEATKQAVRQMIEFLVDDKHLTRDDAYMLASVAADLHITELVDSNVGVHMMLPKSIFMPASSAPTKKPAAPAKPPVAK
jgi:acetamidase/formamidase